MRAAAILGLGVPPGELEAFQSGVVADWQMGLPEDASGVDAVLLLGGDGTLHRHLGQLVDLGLPVLVVPWGSGNDFARAVGMRSVADALAAWRNFVSGARNVRTVDLGLITALAANPEGSDHLAGEAGSGVAQNTRRKVRRYFSCVAGVGLDGEIARRANRLPRWLRAHGGYALSLPGALAGFRSARMTLRRRSVDDEGTWQEHRDQKTLLAAFANTPVYGGGMKVAPRALMDDGLLDVCLIRSVSRLRVMGLFPLVYSGRHLGLKEVEYFQSTGVRVETERALDVYADGEFVCQTPAEIGIAAGAFRVVAP